MPKPKLSHWFSMILHVPFKGKQDIKNLHISGMFHCLNFILWRLVASQVLVTEREK